MKKPFALVALLALLPFVAAQTPAPVAASTPAVAPAGQKVDASAPIARTDAAFLKRHEEILARGKAGPVRLVMLGDSITQGWRNTPHVWEHYYGKLDAANFGIGSDKTQNVIWRIENGEFDGLAPQLVVLMLGTNNSNEHTGDEIAAGNKKIIDLIRAKSPATKFLVLAIFPRDARRNATGLITDAAIADAGKRMAAIDRANALLAKFDDGKAIRFLDIGAQFLGRDGKIPWTLMPDQLHPTAAGYQLWAEAMQPLLAEMMK